MLAFSKCAAGALVVPDSVLNSCERSFLAANKNCEKASTSAFADTGLMAMICHHDHILSMVNITSVGEKQYYAIALLEVLFCELPTWWRAGILYDIVKWNLMPQISDQIEWGIFIFHAFSHQWPCQCVYHLQKCDRFGLSDGEGCIGGKEFF
ncbi:hypothetical protein BS47DRAFT_1374467 [Hydnum rufescens UP504]|uniref:Uncharacterized protein n=1 Tax=Hydnum rufescens UP504 TaxID=1448309 RepID=A0A9P6DFJ5_9AGAM|nr:hypothetical protein BS47DRAFT_1374467 [Hydnum rufescens UP504]